MNEINNQVLSPLQPVQTYNYCKCYPLICEDAYMLRDQMIPEYTSEDSEDEGGYRPGPGSGGGPGPGGWHGPKVWHAHGGYYGQKYYPDINYLYYLNSYYYNYYPYDPYYDYYYNTY